MSDGLKFEDNSMQVKTALDDAIGRWLMEAAGELEAQVKRNTAVDTGKTKGSWRYRVDEGEQKAVVGSDYENAIWEEFGTGVYAEAGNGRKTPWAYKDGEGNWHKTKGKRPRRALKKAFTSMKPKLVRALEEKLKGLG